jgi:hypothetical protein
MPGHLFGVVTPYTEPPVGSHRERFRRGTDIMPYHDTDKCREPARPMRSSNDKFDVTSSATRFSRHVWHRHRRYSAQMIYLKLRQANLVVNHKRGTGSMSWPSRTFGLDCQGSRSYGCTTGSNIVDADKDECMFVSCERVLNWRNLWLYQDLQDYSALRLLLRKSRLWCMSSHKLAPPGSQPVGKL